MTITLVYADAAGGFLRSEDIHYADARDGASAGASVVVMPAGPVHTYGQSVPSGVIFQIFQGFMRFSWPAVPTGEVVATAAIRITHQGHGASGAGRNLEFREIDWTAGGLTTADWVGPTALAAAPLYTWVAGTQSTGTKVIYAGSDSLLSRVQSGTGISLLLNTSRQRAGSIPAANETDSYYSADESGTTRDPCLIYTSAVRSTLAPVLGAETQLSDGSWAMLVAAWSGGTPTVTVQHRDLTGALTSITSAVPIGSTSGDYANPAGTQGVALVSDDQDNLYVIGRAGDAGNALRVRALTKGGGYTWTPQPVRTVPMLSHDVAINNIAATWHPTAGGTLFILAGHSAGCALAGGSEGDLSYALLSSSAVASGSGTLVRASGTALDLITPSGSAGGVWNTITNETGSGLDVVADRDQRDYGYATTFRRGTLLGENVQIPIGRYVLNASGDGFAHSSYESGPYVWATKDAGAKLRVAAVGPGLVAQAGVDDDPDFGITVSIFRVSGLTPGAVELGTVRFYGEGIPSMPDGPDLAGSSAWDIVYSEQSGALWIYYVDVVDPTRIMRTSIDLNTYQAVRDETEVHTLTAGQTVTALRVPRNGRAGIASSLGVGYRSGGVEQFVWVADSHNLPPLAPVLVPVANFDATATKALAWDFTDPTIGDTQSAYRVQVDRVDTGATVVDTGKVASGTESHTVAGGTLTNGQSYRWRVMTWDSSDVVGPWSTYGTFSTDAGGTVTITAPASDNPAGVITDDYLIGWSVSGTTQADYRVWVTRGDTGATVYDTGWLTGSATTHTVTGMVSDVANTIRVQVRTSVGVPSGIGTRIITPSYGTPEVPVLSLTPLADGGYVLAGVTNPLPSGDRPDVTRNRIYRRRAGGGSDLWEEIGTCDPDGSLRDYTAPGGVAVEYLARGEATTGTADSDPATTVLALRGVWLHDPETGGQESARQYPYGSASRSEALDTMGAAVFFAGRRDPVVDYGEHGTLTVDVSVDVPHGATWRTDVEDLMAFAESRQPLFYRDNRGRAMFCTLDGLRTRDQAFGTQVSFTVTRVGRVVEWVML